MGREDQIITERLRKIKELRSKNIDPYPHSFVKKDALTDIREKYDSLKPNKKSSHTVRTAGRVVVTRDFGKIAFATIQDATAKIQLVIQEEETPKKVKEFFKKYIDVGDFVGVSGTLFKTERGELSILVKTITLLSKSIAPLPEKWHGLQDKEERYRKRHLDLIMNQEVREVFRQRASIIDSIREFLKEKKFQEVETPYLQTLYGGAEARPFKTHLNALGIDLFLAVSPELYLKRLIVGGFERVFTIARNFRNEGIDRWHNPEFTMLELYQAYTDYNDMMKLFESLYEYVCKKLQGKTKLKYRDLEIEFKAPWKIVTFFDALKHHANIEAKKLTTTELEKIAKKHNITTKEKNRGSILTALSKELVEPKLIQPTFLIDYPKETSPLCKEKRGHPDLIERFEPFCLGTELGNAYTELNDPIKQKELLINQEQLLKKGNQEANPYDEDFVNALEVGMPPTGGLGLGIDRMCILLTNSYSIRDVILFPFMKPLSDTIKERKEVPNHG